MVVVEGYQYEVVENVRDGFKEEDFIARYSDILAKYDYIVGDWGYNQLRLKGFFDDHNHKATFDTKISTLQDYLYEYCNFGCAYFIVRKVGKAQQEVEPTIAEPKSAKGGKNNKAEKATNVVQSDQMNETNVQVEVAVEAVEAVQMDEQVKA